MSDKDPQPIKLTKDQKMKIVSEAQTRYRKDELIRHMIRKMKKEE